MAKERTPSGGGESSPPTLVVCRLLLSLFAEANGTNACVFTRYSYANLNMMPESLARLDRKANEHGRTSGTPKPSPVVVGIGSV
jgi:hypothetical protein